MNQPRSAVVELIGLPGAGKSTVAFNLSLQKDADRYSPLHSLPEIVISRNPSQIRSLSTLYGFAVFLIRPGRRLFVRALKLALRAYRPKRALWESLKMCRRAQCLDNHLEETKKPVLLDEFLVQNMWSFTVECENFPKTEAEQLLEAILELYHYHIVYLEIEPALALSRIALRGRGHGKLERDPQKQNLSFLTNASKHLDQFVRLYEGLSGRKAHRLGQHQALQWNELTR